MLIVGPPRCGSTWVARAVTVATSATYVHEPDNPDQHGTAHPAVERYGLYPLLSPGDEAPEYKTVWDAAFGGGSEVIVKTVFACLSIPWIVSKYHPRVLLVRRNPLNIVASWRTLGFEVVLQPSYGITAELHRQVIEPLGLPDRPHTTTGTIAWWVGVLYAALEEAREKAGEDWLVLDHDAACLDPEARFAEVLRPLGSSLTAETRRFLDGANQPGTRYQVRRVTRAQPENWRRVLSDRELAESIDALEQFPRAEWQRHLDATVEEKDRRARQGSARDSSAMNFGGLRWRRRLLGAVSLGTAVLALLLATAGTLLRPAAVPLTGASPASQAVYLADLPDGVTVPGGVDPSDSDALDIKGTGAYVDGDDIVGRIDIGDASEDAIDKPLAEYRRTPSGSHDGNEVSYTLQFQHAGKIYFLGFTQDASGVRRGIGGTVAATSPVPRRVTQALDVKYELVGNSIFLRGRAAAVQAHDGDVLHALSAHSFLGAIDSNEADSVRAFDAILRSWTWQPLVLGSGCPQGCLVPAKTLTNLHS